MADVSDQIVTVLPYLRRYARALVGDQSVGDTYVRICLEALVEEPSRVSATGDVRLQLFSLFHEVWARTGVRDGKSDMVEAGELRDLSVESRLKALPPTERQALLLTTLEGFSVEHTAEILKVPESVASELVSSAWSAVNQQMATTILIIEDEPVIALDVAGLVTDMGHSVIGVASSQSEAVRIARKSHPGLVLADIDLGAGGSGLNAVKSILETMTVPVIFVTAYPERLLTGERPEPTYLVTKPFEPDMLKVTISQALSFFGTGQQAKQAV
jgi:CheY-like chemotaxis protein/DNA-directed RNA polymerase specialized sigma24 family protein